MSQIITACICTYKRYDLLPLAIQSLIDQNLPKDKYKIMIVDNSPHLEKADEFGKKYHSPPFIIYKIEKIPGLSNARNVALRECETEYISYMDDDAIASPDWLERIVEAFETFGDNAVCVGGRVDPIWEVPRPSWLSEELMGYLSVVNWGGSEIRIAEPHEWFAGTNIAFRVKDILEAGGFNVNLGRIGSGSVLLSNEEILLINHLREKGKEMVYHPFAVVKHLVPADRLTQNWFRKRVAWQAISDYMMNPEKSMKEAINRRNEIIEYFFDLPPKYININGLFVKEDYPERFKKQMRAIRILLLFLLSGYDLFGGAK